MPAAICPDCSVDVPFEAETCPNCGRSMIVSVPPPAVIEAEATARSWTGMERVGVVMIGLGMPLWFTPYTAVAAVLVVGGIGAVLFGWLGAGMSRR